MDRPRPAQPVPLRLRREFLHTFAAMACVLPYLSYVFVDYGWSASQIGYAGAVLPAASLVAGPVWGWFGDRWPQTVPRVAMLTTAGAAAAIAIAIETSGYWAALIALAAYGAASSPLEPLLTAAALRLRGSKEQLGNVRAMGSVGWIIGLLAGGLVLDLAGHSALVFLVAAGLMTSGPRPEPGARVAVASAGGMPVRPVLRVMALTFPLPFCMSTFVIFTAGWVHGDLGLGAVAATSALMLSAALEVPAFLLIDRIGRRVTPTALIATAFLPLCVAWTAVTFASSLPALLAVQPLVAVSFALWFVGQASAIAERVPPERLASAQTLAAVVTQGVVRPAAGLIGGAIAAQAGFGAIFATLAVVSLLGSVAPIVSALRENLRGPVS